MPLGKTPYFPDGADVVEQLIEIPLPGRTFASPTGDAFARGPGATLPSFVAGPENRVAASVVGRLRSAPLPSDEEAADLGPGPGGPSLLALYGPNGVGKTHLVRGLVEHWQQHRGADRAAYVTAADFRREYLAAIGCEAVVEFRRRFRTRELLAIDDLHQLPSDQFLMEELRYTLDDCQDAGRIVLVTAPRAASCLSNLPADVRSRLAAGLVLQLAPPGAAARLAILGQASAALGRRLSDDAARRLAGRVSGTANELIGALFQLLSATPSGAVTELEQVDEYLSARAARQCTLREMIAVVARYYDLPQKVLKSGSRKQAAVLARATVVYLARELAGASYEQIGRALGGRDHTTIMHNFRTIQRDRQRDWQTLETLDELRRILLSP
ncbi:MAG: DnaA/Hda family protein [Pirellulales bacterium]